MSRYYHQNPFTDVVLGMTLLLGLLADRLRKRGYSMSDLIGLLVMRLHYWVRDEPHLWIIESFELRGPNVWGSYEKEYADTSKATCRLRGTRFRRHFVYTRTHEWRDEAEPDEHILASLYLKIHYAEIEERSQSKLDPLERLARL